MPRHARRLSRSGYYHVIIRGVNKQNIFNDDSDREKFIQCMKKYKQKSGIDIVVYCLMSNHVHIMMKALDGPSDFMKKLSSSYVYYFNHKYERCGHLFQDRYKSELIENDAYFVTVVSYILNNPAKAGIARVDQYSWNSWQEIDFPELCDMSLAFDLFGGSEKLKAYVKNYNDDCEIMEYDTCVKKNTESIIKTILAESNIRDIRAFALVEHRQQRKVLQKVYEEGVSERQVSNITGLSRTYLRKIISL